MMAPAAKYDPENIQSIHSILENDAKLLRYPLYFLCLVEFIFFICLIALLVATSDVSSSIKSKQEKADQDAMKIKDFTSDFGALKHKVTLTINEFKTSTEMGYIKNLVDTLVVKWTPEVKANYDTSKSELEFYQKAAGFNLIYFQEKHYPRSFYKYKAAFVSLGYHSEKVDMTGSFTAINLEDCAKECYKERVNQANGTLCVKSVTYNIDQSKCWCSTVTNGGKYLLNQGYIHYRFPVKEQ